jgi:hypothetical protein
VALCLLFLSFYVPHLLKAVCQDGRNDVTKCLALHTDRRFIATKAGDYFSERTSLIVVLFGCTNLKYPASKIHLEV